MTNAKGNWDGLARLCDTFFNGRKAESKASEPGAESGKPGAESGKPPITVRDLVERRVSVVRFAGKMYRITVEDYEGAK